MKLISRKEMATLLVEDQIKRGIVKRENKKNQIQARLTGMLKMSWFELHNYCEKYGLIQKNY